MMTRSPTVPASGRKGVLLAGGEGSRLAPLTRAISKQLLPIYDKPLVYYPLSILMLAGVRDVLLISTPQHLPLFKSLLSDGDAWGMKIDYQVQTETRGVADAMLLAENWLDGAPSILALGDNVLYSTGLSGLLKQAADTETGATVFACPVRNPEQFGVVGFDGKGQAINLEEKPRRPGSEWAVIGLYFYDETAPEKARRLIPSTRDELEIIDLNRLYLDEQTLNVIKLSRGATWLDTGTLDGLVTAGEWVRAIERQHGFKVACPEEIAWRNGWIDNADLSALANQHKSEYGAYLQRLSASAPCRP